MKKRLAAEFDFYIETVFEGRVIPEEASEELKKAFYAGAIAMNTLVSENISDGDDATADEEEFLNGIYNEIQEFVNELNGDVTSETETREG